MMRKRKLFSLLAVGGLVWGSGLLWAQQQAPDTILRNGKIVTVNSHELNENLGTIAQALAIREGKIVAVGTNAEVSRLAGPNTKSIDLKGRTVIPGFIVTHDHPQDWDTLNEKIVKKVVSDDSHIERFLSVPPEEVLRRFPVVLEEASQKAKPTPGKWVRISLLYGKDYNYDWRAAIQPMLGRQINQQMLDLAAPNNPVEIRLGFVGSLLNQKGIEQVDKVYGEAISHFPPGATGRDFYGYRYSEPGAVYTPDELREIYRLGLSWYTGYGQTLNGTALYSPGQIRAYSTLDRRGQLPMRFSWSWFWSFRNDFFVDPYFTQALVTLLGSGSDYFWLDGIDPEHGGMCSKLEPTPEGAAEKERACANPTYGREAVARALYEFVKAGGRMSGNHMMADYEVDLMLDTIEKASKDAGMTLDDIRAKRHISNHMAMYPRADQIPRYKNLGMMVSGWDITWYDGGAREVMHDYGERGVQQIVPRKALLAAGVMNNLENDRPIEYTDLTFFHILYSGITHKDQNGTVYAPATAVDRQTELKVATLFGAYAAKRENVLGSLEPGKWADLVVIDKDYLTVPVDDIPKIRVLMTMVGGKVQHLTPSLAREIGLPPAGAQVELGGAAASW